MMKSQTTCQNGDRYDISPPLQHNMVIARHLVTIISMVTMFFKQTIVMATIKLQILPLFEVHQIKNKLK